MGKPSHDRVRFFLSESRVDNQREQFAELLKFAFDMDLCQFKSVAYFHTTLCACGVTVICRPSQFARFLIKRNELGLSNGFKELHPELFIPEGSPTVLDVSKRTHKDPRMGHGHGCQDEDEVTL